MLALRYVAFAILATLVNLAAQVCVFTLYQGTGAIYFAIFTGTLTGLIVKYLLDKQFIFEYQSNNMRDDAQKFALYSLMGIFTTLLFWAVELGFDFFIAHDHAKYWGAVVGLSLGYLLKYQLDKRFVFVQTKIP